MVNSRGVVASAIPRRGPYGQRKALVLCPQTQWQRSRSRKHQCRGQRGAPDQRRLSKTLVTAPTHQRPNGAFHGVSKFGRNATHEGAINYCNINNIAPESTISQTIESQKNRLARSINIPSR
jgi:hypothetical protein